MSNSILDTGLSVVYEAEKSPPIVDIVFVHGLQGHPSKTWTYRPKIPDSLESTTPTSEKDAKRSNIRRIFWRRSKTSPTGGTQSTSTILPEENDNNLLNPIFWPADLLPKECPGSRILVFGYDSKVTKYRAGAINHNSILSHSKDLLFSLHRERHLNRPLVFVAHSLGGIIVKEMLARSSSSSEAELRDIVESTASIIFLGTPHRGSQGVVALGEVVRSVISSLGMETTPVILDALGLKTTDLLRAQEDFSTLWQRYNFRVKTFQEGLSLAKLKKKVVPDHSSLIGDSRERAETLQANHMEMCRYSGKDDPNYRKVAGELRSIYHSIPRLNAADAPSDRPIQLTCTEPVLSAAPPKQPPQSIVGSQGNENCLESLWFPAINARFQSLQRPADHTCSWLFDHEVYQDWFNDKGSQKSYGLLWLKGKPGAGKSILMKEAFCRAVPGQAESNYRTASFFFNAKGDELEHSSLGLFRSLLYQLLPGDQHYMRSFQEIWDDKRRASKEDKGTKMVTWAESDLKSFFESVILHETKRKIIIFIDGLDECDEPRIRPMATFWREITVFAHRLGIDLNVCLSSRHFPTITLNDCPEIVVEGHNANDMATYVDYKFQVGISSQRSQWETLRNDILAKADGVFLWVVLVVEDMLKKWDEGNGLAYLTKQARKMPEALETLFLNIFSSIKPDEKELTVRFFQWAVLATKPLRLHEWHHIMAFIRHPELKSLSEWRESPEYAENDEQLEKQIRKISRGLVEVKRVWADDPQDDKLEVISTHARAGSLNLEHGDSRIVQVIHQSVREFFLTGKGFSVLDPRLKVRPLGNGHLSIVATCLAYLHIQELNALAEARIHAARGKMNQGRSRSDSAVSSHNTRNSEFRDMPERESRSPQVKTSEFEMLISLECFTGIDIMGWIEKGDNSAGQTYIDELPCKSMTHSSLSQLQLLEDYPALLSYATVRLFTHIQLAEEDEIDPRPFIRLLKHRATWDRWVALREGIPDETTLASYLIDMDLWRWMEPFFHGPITDDMIREGHRLSEITQNYSSHPSQPKVVKLSSRPRRQSIVSFESASTRSYSTKSDHILKGHPC